MASPVDDVAFLVRSETRVNVLRAVDAGPHDRQELATATETPRSTLGRTLSELEEYGWITRTGRNYEITTAGSLILDRFDPLVDVVTVQEKLGEAVELLPTDKYDLPVEHFADATFVTPSEHNPTAPFEYGVEQLRSIDEFRGVASAVPRQYVRAIHRGVVGNTFTAELALTDSYLDGIREDDDALELWCEVANTDTVFRRVTAPVPFVLLVLDDVVHLWLCNAHGETEGLVESDHSAVLSWANTTVTDFLEGAPPAESIVCESTV